MDESLKRESTALEIGSYEYNRISRACKYHLDKLTYEAELEIGLFENTNNDFDLEQIKECILSISNGKVVFKESELPNLTEYQPMSSGNRYIFGISIFGSKDPLMIIFVIIDEITSTLYRIFPNPGREYPDEFLNKVLILKEKEKINLRA